MKYKFIPNKFAKKFFKLTKNSYKGKGITSLLTNVLGKENYEKYMCAQDPMHKDSKGIISICLNRLIDNDIQYLETHNFKFRTIGIIKKVLF